MANFNKSDLEFILKQIFIAEAHADGASLSDLLPNSQVPYGLRTVDGSYNNLVAGQSEFGAADNSFLRLLDASYRASYAGTGTVVDPQPRIISNLINDQTANNPAAVAANGGADPVISPGLDGVFGTADDKEVFFIPNESPDAGLTAGFNSWMTFFGQFFDHGLDLLSKSSTDVVFIPLQPDDPLFVPGSPTNFMVLPRAVRTAGADGIVGTSDDGQPNTTSPFVDQSQTYSSHPSHQVFLREYVLNAAGDPIATGRLITNRDLGADGKFGTADDGDGESGGMATWAVVKAQARDILGINLTDLDVHNVPLLATDAYGSFIRGPNGMPQVVMRTSNGTDGIAGTADDVTQLVEGNRDAPISLANAVSTGHGFLDDIAHNAAPVVVGGVLQADADADVGNAQPVGAGGNNLTYDNELLDAHYIAGDGRANENIGLTAVHHVFHSEHNRLVQQSKQTILAAGDLAFLNEWLVDDVAAMPTTLAEISALVWDGERLFQAAKFGTEMQYQHLVFEEFARTIQPQVDAFLAPNGYDTSINPAILAEFAHVVYRFGHSMLTETVDRFDPEFNPLLTDPNNPDSQMGLIAAFLNPLAFAGSGATADEAAGAIIRGVTRQLGNEIDEFVTEALRNNLLGLPLDLPALNLARGRDTGIPTLNEARREFYSSTGDSQLKPYISWADFADNLKHPESLVNFIAAYGTHETITAATTLADKRAAALALVFGGDDAPADRLDFLNSTGAYGNVTLAGKDGLLGTADDVTGVTITGVDDIDFWVGGLAEQKMPFGGMLGSSFNFVFETQMEALQDGDRFYYLSRTAGLNFGTELENNSFAKLIMLNTDVTHLSNTVFLTPTYTLEVNQANQFTGLGAGSADPTGGLMINGVEIVPLVIRDNPDTVGADSNYLQYTGEDHVVLGGTAGNDIIVSGEGDDTLYGDGGNDRLEGGAGNDAVLGGAGDDIITDSFGDNRLEGNAGNDVIVAGSMLVGGNLILGGDGQDFIITTEDISTTFGGQGDDFILGAKTNLPATGNEGDDWIESGTQDGAPGDNASPLLNDDVIGNDIFVGGGGFDEMIGEGGDDIFVGSDAQDNMDGMSGFDWVTYKNDRVGVTVDLTMATLAQPHGNAPNQNNGPFNPVGASPTSILDRFAEVEGLSGSQFGDVLKGDNVDAVTIADHGGTTGSALTNVALIRGLEQFLADAGLPTTGFATGNIILGGNGSDLIEGRGGDDLIDGDKWINVRIAVYGPNDVNHTGPEIATFDSMVDMIPFMIDGTYNPGQLKAVREILPGTSTGGAAFDTAVFSGLQSEYVVTRDTRGTANVADDVWTVTDTEAGRDGTDTLLHIERLQFADTQQVLVPDLNAQPLGRPTVADGNGGAITVGDTLTVSMAGVRDSDNITVGNPQGFVNNASVSYYWQFEADPGTGVFEDIIQLPAGDLAFQSADGTTFKVSPDLAGLALRVKAIYQDGHGTTEVVFSQPTDVVAPGEPVVPTAQTPVVNATAGGEGLNMVRSDLNFILDQIKIAEADAAGQDILSLIPNIRAPLGLRAVDGSNNNLMNLNGINNTEFGAADNTFPRLTDPVFNPAEGAPAGFFGPGSPAIPGSSYQQNSGFVFDSQPRTISNLIVDQTSNNPAAYATAYDPGADGVLNFGAEGNDDVLKDGTRIVASPGMDGQFGTADDHDVYLFENTASDAGLSAPFNAWMTFFGQFFDHGLDLVTKGGSGTIFIPLQPDDPLYVPGGNTNFMVLTRATNLPGADGVLGTADDIHEHTNTTSPFVDQNQTYSSHPSHQVFLRGYELTDNGPIATGRLITNRDLGADGKFGTADDTEIGGMATWKVVKAQANDILGIRLTDADVDNSPLLATDAYGNFIKGPNGFPMVVMKGADGLGGTADDVLVEGNPLDPISLTNAVRTGHQFLADIAHNAAPVFSGGVLVPDADSDTGNAVPFNPQTGANLAYDNELLDAHYIAGDGRVNENIGLTAVHAIFHSEHNRLVAQTKDTVLDSGDVAFLNEWLLTPVSALPANQAEIDALVWNGERLFQAAKFGTEMQYQHLVFEEFARTIQPNVDLFFAPTQVYDVDLDASIVAEFAHTVYRFGHSMLTETVDRFDVDFNVIGDPNSADPDQQLGLIAAFLNPLAYAASGVTPEDATSAIVRGMTRQAGNEIDEFVTEALRNNLLGLPLDLPAINIARGRDVGIPSLNAVRRDIYSQTGDTQLKPYISWVDLVQHLKHPESLINFIAAYGTHSTITEATTLEAKRAAAMALVFGGDDAPADRLDFLNGTGTWANVTLAGKDGVMGTADDLKGVTITGVDAIDLWIGGLAEEKTPFGGMLGSTFNFVFENQLEKLQDGDRFYYLERTAGLSMNAELESNSFAKLIMANTSATHLPGLVFSDPGFYLERDQSKQYNDGLGNADPLGENGEQVVFRDNPLTAGPDTNYIKYTGDQHIVLGGTNNADILIASEGDDTVWGDGGNDVIEGGDGNDQLRGGAGDDIITDRGGDDNIQGGDGNDVLHGGNGVNLIIGGFGNDFIVTGEDASEAIGGHGNDFILGSKANEQDMGNEGDDWIEKGTSDGAPGDNFDPLGNDPIIGHDVFIGASENDKFNGEGGDDIMVGSLGLGDRYIGGSGYDWATFKGLAQGVTIDFTDRFFDVPPVPGSGASALVRFDIMEGLSGSSHGDYLRGDNEDATTLPGAGATGSVLTNINLIDGLVDLLPAGATFFDGGNIILGGSGSDLIEGRGGDDIIDGDKWLNVRISVRENVDGTGEEIATFDSMEPLVPFMLNGTYNPGQLVIVREILTGNDSYDTALFSGNLGEYGIEIDGDTVIVTDSVAGRDGVDRLTGIERLQFADVAQSSGVGTAQNNDPSGHLAILDAATGVRDETPVAGQLLRVSDRAVHDADNQSGTNPTGAVTGGVAYYWQVETIAGTGVYDDITSLAAGEATRAIGTTYRVTDDVAGLNIRVRAVYQDAKGTLEIVDSSGNSTPTEGPTVTGLAVQNQLLTADPSSIIDLDGLSNPQFTYQWQANDGLGFVNIAGATGSTFALGQAQVDQEVRVVIGYVDAFGVAESVSSNILGPVENVNDAPTAGPTLTGLAVQNQVLTADPASIIDVDGLSNPQFTYQWQANNGSGFVDINGATGSTFALGQAQVGQAVRVVIGYVDDFGAAESVSSNTLGPVANANDAPTGALLISDTTPNQGQVLTALTGEIVDADGLGTFSFQWQQGVGVSFTDINGATAATFTPGAAQGNLQLRVIVRYTDGFGTLESVTSAATAAVTVLSGVVLQGNAFANTLTGTAGNDVLIGLGGSDTLNGLAGIDQLFGGTGNDILNGGDDNDVLNGEDGTDTLNGGLGADTMNGGAGNDTFVVDNVGDLVTEALGGGTDLVRTSLTSYQLGANVENLTYTGTANFTGTGNALANIITGGVGSDLLNGGAGADRLVGGAGNDTYVVDAALDVVVEVLGGGTDTVQTSLASYTLGANVENLTYTGVGNFVGNGNGLNNVITAGAGNDTLNGNDGNDQLFGGIGTDTLNGGNGDDSLDGGDGADVLNGGSGNDTLLGGDANDILLGGTGIDFIDGGIGNDTVTGGAGNDMMVASSGNDIFMFAAGFGADQIIGFDADAVGGQDRLDISSFGVTAATFAGIVIITDIGADTLISSAGPESIRLVGVADATTVTAADFILAT
ncbi:MULTISPECIES: peroxidase family protein [unclassified Pseudomonas]|uniref:peroxidase family protein n=1 Tax=unclassified Pseudomonas TaxID=196821 RepID=UPI000C86D286|nr:MULTISPECIES: peroxidase family protein [unclassified Pseudomonas]PMV86516.1 heme peroxidase [Pseudomonas sp. GW101-1A09]PMV96316.1 heme peroxidase [Pseudomonas sp. FW306-2-2C-B10A]PMV97986.1 heme peroxidase [Pseudomonas sp. GW460-C8]PMW05011.1 heme peroxidase [Pseudomonas sp. MPR-TSA4]PMW18053.1 heme peroxidase [Pseudomonas sp. GW456-E6]